MVSWKNILVLNLLCMKNEFGQLDNGDLVFCNDFYPEHLSE